MSRVGRMLGRGVNLTGETPFEDWLAVAVSQLVGCRHLLYNRAGLLFGFRIGWHVYTAQGDYVGSFAERVERGITGGLFSPGGDYLGELDPEDDDRLAVDFSRLGERRQRTPALPTLTTAVITLFSVRSPLLPRAGWGEFPDPGRFVPRDRADHTEWFSPRSCA